MHAIVQLHIWKCFINSLNLPTFQCCIKLTQTYYIILQLSVKKNNLSTKTSQHVFKSTKLTSTVKSLYKHGHGTKFLALTADKINVAKQYQINQSFLPILPIKMPLQLTRVYSHHNTLSEKHFIWSKFNKGHLIPFRTWTMRPTCQFSQVYCPSVQHHAISSPGSNCSPPANNVNRSYCIILRLNCK